MEVIQLFYGVAILALAVTSYHYARTKNVTMTIYWCTAWLGTGITYAITLAR